MDVPTWLWWTTIVVTVGFLLIDVLIIGRRPHEPTTREVSRDLVFYIGAAILFGIGVWYFAGAQYGGEFFAGWLTEYSLSVDNLFVFIIIMTKLQVPRPYQQTALLIGIVIALVMRGIFIAVGAAAINQFSWVFYLFGLFLIWTAYKLAKDDDLDGEHYDQPRIVKYAQTHLPVTDKWNGVKLSIKENGKRLYTPMFIVVLSLGMTDLLFALDSIPAIYGLTNEPYLVLTANVFALMGLRQLYFLHRRPAQAAGLPVLRPRRAARLHRREAGLPRAARERAAVHQRRRARGVGARDPDLGLAARDRRHPGRDDDPEPGQGLPRPPRRRRGIASTRRVVPPW